MKKVLLKSMLLFAAILTISIAQAQTVTGTVTEEAGPLPGASVIVKGTSNGTTTDFDGNYTLNDVGANATLVFSYVGFANQEIAVNGQSVINATLAGGNELDEVVLIGYGSTTIRDATGSIASVTSEDFNQGVIQSPEQLIQGKTAGVQISESSGEPGAGIAIRIRGNNSIRSGNNPLFVVDGVPLTSGAAPAINVEGVGGGTPRNPLSFLNPNDIESISVLKDASATAIYGSRGANGVVIIQTKSGRGSSKGVWDLATSVSSSAAANTYDLLNREQFLAVTAATGLSPLDGGADGDFQDFYTQEAFSRRTDLSYSKSYKNGNVRASFGYSNTNGVVVSTAQERLAGRLNAQHRFLDDRLTISLQSSISRVNDDFAPISGSAGSAGDLIGGSLGQNPTFPVDPDFTAGGGVINPVNLLANFIGRTNSNRLLANLSAEYAISDAFTAKVTVGYDESQTTSVAGTGSDVLGVQNVSTIGRGNFNTFDQENQLLEATLSYKKEFENSSLDIIGGFSYQQFRRLGVNATAAGFSSANLEGTVNRFETQFNIIDDAIDGNYQVAGFGVDGSFVNRLFPINFNDELSGDVQRLFPAFTASLFDNTDELQSFFTRANYTLRDKFLFTGTFRADGSSTFGPDNRYGFFPSGAFAWQLHEEDFVGDNVSTLKLRLGVGVVGSQEGLAFGEFLQRFVAAGGGIQNTLEVLPRPGLQTAGFTPNPALKWEETTDFNVGLDFGFNNDRFNGSFNLYRKETRDLLLVTEQAAPAATADGLIFRNIDDGVVVNQGVELELNYDFIETDDFSFSASFNIAFNQNEVQDTQVPINAGPINGAGLTAAFVQRLEAGQPLFSFFLPEFTGFDDLGNPTYRDINGDGEGDPFADRFFVGENAIPEFTSGLSLNARYKNFDLSTYFNGQFGFSVYNATANAFFTAGALNTGRNVTSNISSGNAGNTALGIAPNGESIAATADPSTRFLESGDFVRLTSATLGYNWPVSGEGLFDSLRLNVTGQNLFLITGYSGLDPEVSVNTGNLNASAIPSAGIDFAQFPRPRTFTLGVNARF